MILPLCPILLLVFPVLTGRPFENKSGSLGHSKNQSSVWLYRKICDLMSLSQTCKDNIGKGMDNIFKRDRSRSKASERRSNDSNSVHCPGCCVWRRHLSSDLQFPAISSRVLLPSQVQPYSNSIVLPSSASTFKCPSNTMVAISQVSPVSTTSVLSHSWIMALANFPPGPDNIPAQNPSISSFPGGSSPNPIFLGMFVLSSCPSVVNLFSRIVLYLFG